MRPLPNHSRVILLNLPGKQVYIRDYYCSKTSKTNYLFAPCDLSMLSGRLAEKYDIGFIDCIADRISERACLSRLSAVEPQAIIFLAGAVSWQEDTEFLARLKEKLPGSLLIGTGDIFLEDCERLLVQHPFIDAALIDFSTDDLVRYLEGDIPNNMYIRQNGEVCALPVKRGAYEKFSLPIPRHDLFRRKHYRLPFLIRPFATVLTDFGCPFKCSFCVMSTLGYRYRDVDNVLEEVALIRSLGMENIFFIDQTFRPRQSDNLELCDGLLKESLRCKWICYSRVDVVNEEILSKMKEAGCQTIIFGVESGSPQILAAYRKGYTLDQIHETFALCKKLRIRTVGTFIIGLPEDTEQSCRETIELACSLDCDYASFNFAVPRAGTPLRDHVVKEGLISPVLKTMDQSGSFIVMPTLTLSTEQLRELRKLAIRKFYLRPNYLLKRFREASSFQELREAVYAGISLLRNVHYRYPT